MLTAQAISLSLKVPISNVKTIYPLLQQALVEQGLLDPLILIAALATIATETPAFLPIREKIANPNKQPDLYKSQARYAPYSGRGLIQLTWKDNYEHYGKELGIDLVDNPDLALDPKTSCRILALFFKERHLDLVAQTKDWTTLRKLVNGGVNGLERFLTCIDLLLAL